jgi:hypothetical protein
MSEYARGRIQIKDNANKIKPEKGRLKGKWGREEMMYNLVK